MGRRRDGLREGARGPRAGGDEAEIGRFRRGALLAGRLAELLGKLELVEREAVGGERGADLRLDQAQGIGGRLIREDDGCAHGLAPGRDGDVHGAEAGRIEGKGEGGGGTYPPGRPSRNGDLTPCPLSTRWRGGDGTYPPGPPPRGGGGSNGKGKGKVRAGGRLGGSLALAAACGR